VLLAVFGVVFHSLDDKAVDAITGPLVTAAQRLENHQRFTQIAAMFESAVEGEVKAQAPRCDHPIEDIAAGVAQRLGVGIMDADGRN